MPGESPGLPQRSGSSGSGGRGWNVLRQRTLRRGSSGGDGSDTNNGRLRRSLNNNAGSNHRRPNLLQTMKMTSFRFSQTPMGKGDIDLPEEGGDLHKHFRTCASLTRIREEFRNALSEDAEKNMGFGLNACARPEDSTGKLLLHSIGLNKDLVTSGGGGSAAVTRVNQFVLQELLPVSFCRLETNTFVSMFGMNDAYVYVLTAICLLKFATMCIH